MMYLSQAYVSIQIYGDDFSPSELTRLLGLTPTDFGMKGEKGKYAPALKECFWQYRLDKTNALEELDESLRKLMADFQGKVSLVKSYMLEKDLNAKCYIVIEAKDGEDSGVLFNIEFIDFLNKLSASVEVDIYNV